jgi:hypothetical protein
MSAVCVLTPLVISSWPVISAAIVGAAASMGFAVRGDELHEEEQDRTKTVETEIENSEIVAEEMNRGQRIVIQKGDVTIAFGVDERGRCAACVSGKNYSDAELRRIGEEVAGRVVQQFAYSRLLSELKKRHYQLVEEEVLQDGSVQLRVRL